VTARPFTFGGVMDLTKHGLYVKKFNMNVAFSDTEAPVKMIGECP
jgi:hypothetical protein